MSCFNTQYRKLSCLHNIEILNSFKHYSACRAQLTENGGGAGSCAILCRGGGVDKQNCYLSLTSKVILFKSSEKQN